MSRDPIARTGPVRSGHEGARRQSRPAGETRFRRAAQDLQCRRGGHRRHAGRDPPARPQARARVRRRLDPAFVPDVIVRAAADGAWHVELNTEVLPRILVNHTYAARITKANANDVDKTFMSTCLQTANWLTKSLEQRARTILKVSSEIVRQQDAFFRSRRRTFASAQPQDDRRGDRHARIDGVARDLEQIYGDAARPVRTEIFLHRLDRLAQWRRRAFGRIGRVSGSSR